jgi:hypothetical protein
MVISCRSAVAHLTEREEGGASFITRVGLRLHLSVCRECCLYLGQLRAVRAALRALAGAELAREPGHYNNRLSQGDVVAPETRARLLAGFRAWRASLPGGARDDDAG